MDGDENNQENTCLCCRPFMPETPYFKKMKPILIAGILVYTIVGLLDAFYLKHYNLMDFLLIIHICKNKLINTKCLNMSKYSFSFFNDI
jgi:hypothetical protein